MAAGETTGCDAVHPGYGFLSENPDFVRACEDNDLVFIGPDADVMARMGDKVEAKRELAAAGLPLVPGTEAVGADEAAKAAAEIGYPVLLKASAGGGGKGMRLVERADDLDDAFERASGEALAAFGDGTLYLEKLITPARHVEVQVLCDADGGVLTLGERECSIQRRHQKLIEESPSPALDDATREAMETGGGAGLPRDLVPERRHLRVSARARRLVLLHRAECAPAGRASGQRARDRDRHRAGAAADRSRRAVARNRSRGAARARDRDPAQRRRSGARLRAGAGSDRTLSASARARASASTRTSRKGPSIPPYYDSLIGKLIVWDEDRASAIERSLRALSELELRGVPTTREAALEILASDTFRSGRYSTSFLDETRLAAVGAG